MCSATRYVRFVPIADIVHSNWSRPYNSLPIARSTEYGPPPRNAIAKQIQPQSSVYSYPCRSQENPLCQYIAVIISSSIAAAAAKKRVNNPRISAMPARVSVNSAVQNHGAGGVKPISTKAFRNPGVGPTVILPQLWTSRFQPAAAIWHQPVV